VYAASKTQQEQETWAFVRERKPHFTVNSVIPNTLFGPLLVPGKQQNTSTNGFVTGIYKTGWATVEYIPPREFSPSSFMLCQHSLLLYILTLCRVSL
jgi:hypothetical protein